MNFISYCRRLGALGLDGVGSNAINLISYPG